MIRDDEFKEKRLYVVIAIFIIIVIAFLIFISSNTLTPSYVPDEFLAEGWSEDLNARDSGQNLFGLEKWCSITYTYDGKYPAYLTVTTIKTIVMMNEEYLQKKTSETIEEAIADNIEINKTAMIEGERFLKNGCKTMYIVYNGTTNDKEPYEKVKIIGEVWTNGPTGVSIICIGFAQITDFSDDINEVNYVNWGKIVNDLSGTFGQNFIGEDGLIYNISSY